MEIEEKDFKDLIQAYFEVANKHQDREIEGNKIVYKIANKYGYVIRP